MLYLAELIFLIQPMFILCVAEFRTQDFKMETGIKIVAEATRAEISGVASRILCAGMCSSSNTCCSSSYENTTCYLDSICNPVTEVCNDAVTIRKIINCQQGIFDSIAPFSFNFKIYIVYMMISLTKQDQLFFCKFRLYC